MSGTQEMPKRRRIGRTRLYPGPRRSAAGRFWRWVASPGAAGGFTGFFAPAPPAQTMPQALAEAYNTNPQLLAQRALLRATDEQVPQALSFWRPQVTFTGQAGISANSIQSPPLVGVTDRRHVQLSPNLLQFQANQPVYRGGRTEAQTRQAINTVEST